MGTGRVLTGVGLAAMFAAIVVALLANTSKPPSGQSASPGLRVPAALTGTLLTSAVRGPAAVAEVSRLHGTAIEATDAVVARYGGGITIWVSASPSPLRASSLLWRMNRRMAGGTTVFSDPRPQEIRGRTVFTTQGLNQLHYYYQSDRYVLWLAVPASAAGVIEDLLNLYP